MFPPVAFDLQGNQPGRLNFGVSKFILVCEFHICTMCSVETISFCKESAACYRVLISRVIVGLALIFLHVALLIDSGMRQLCTDPSCKWLFSEFVSSATVVLLSVRPIVSKGPVHAILSLPFAVIPF